MPHAAPRARSAGPIALWRRRRPTPPRVLAALARVLLFAGLCVTGSALLALLGAGSASAAPATPGKQAAHPDGTAHAAGVLDGVGHLTRSVLDPAAGPARAPHHRSATAHHHARSTDAADAGVVPSLLHSVLTGHGPDADAEKPAASHPRPEHHADSGDGIGGTAVSGITAADRVVASVARSVAPVTTVVSQVVAPVRPVTAALTAPLTAPLAPVVGKVVTPLQPITKPAGHLLTATGLVPVRGAASRPGSGSTAHHLHATAAAVASPAPGFQTFETAPAAPIAAAGIGRTELAPGAKAPRSGDAPADEPAPFWPIGVTFPAAGTSSSNSINSGAGGNVAAGHAERVGAAPWPRVIGIAYSFDDIARQLDAGKPQVSPD